MTDIKNLLEVKRQTIDIVREAGDLLLSYYGRKIDSRSKGGVDFATAADDAIDNFLRAKLAEKFPDSKFLTEETAPSDYLSLKDQENLWVIDPIDGTTNFSRGIEPFCISVGLVSHGQALLGVVFEPTKDRLYHATSEEEYASIGQSRLLVSTTNNLSESYLTMGMPWEMVERDKANKHSAQVYPKVRALGNRGSAASDLCEVAAGRLDGSFFLGIKPWDIAAGSLFVLKAGGEITRINGSEWNVFSPDILVSNKILHTKLLELLN